MALVTVPCDLCGSVKFRPIYPGTIAEPDVNPAQYYSSSRTQVGYLPVVQCLHCGLWQTNPRDDAATLRRIYASLTDPAYEAEDQQRRYTAKAYLAWVHRYCAAPGRLLDIGCATGTFACEAEQAGWQVTGLEASAWSLAYARHRCDNVTWVNALVETAVLAEEQFDVITVWDVLEHVASPTSTLRQLRRWLKPGGWLFLNLPNRASQVARLLGPHWVLLLREHVWYFSPPTLQRLLNKTGYQLINTRPNHVHFSWANIAGRLGQYPGGLGLAGQWLATWSVLKRGSLTFPIGEMTVAAQTQ
jgi:SAM-dependent methyltransferase